MGLLDGIFRALDNAASEVFKGATGLDPRNPEDRKQIAEKVRAAEDLQALRRQQEISEYKNRR
jgi:hypothetical protein